MIPVHGKDKEMADTSVNLLGCVGYLMFLEFLELKKYWTAKERGQ